MSLSYVTKADTWGGASGYHFQVKGLSAGINSVNPATVYGNNWPSVYVPIGAGVFSIYDGVSTTPSKVMIDYATLTNTNIDIYCDATGSLWADVFLW